MLLSVYTFGFVIVLPLLLSCFHQLSLPPLLLVLLAVEMVIGKTSCNDPAHPDRLVLKDLQFVNLVMAVPPGKIEAYEPAGAS